MKTKLTLLLILIPFQIFSQIEPENELEKIFYNLPIRSDIKAIVDSVKKIETIKPYENNNRIISSKPYYSGHLTINRYFSDNKICGRIRIYHNDIYSLYGTEVKDLDIVYMSINFNPPYGTSCRRMYKWLIQIFKIETVKNNEYKTQRLQNTRRVRSYLSFKTKNNESREISLGNGRRGRVCWFFKSENDKLPFLSISIGNGDCPYYSNSLIINYYKVKN